MFRLPEAVRVTFEIGPRLGYVACMATLIAGLALVLAAAFRKGR